MIRINDNLKTYGKETSLWYHPHQGETFPLLMDTKQGYLVVREEQDRRNWLVKHKHATREPDLPSDDDRLCRSE